MKKHYEKLIADIRTEACELADKIKRLEVFIMSEDFCRISQEQKKLLKVQYDLMAKYKVTLVKRAHRINYEHFCLTQEPEPERAEAPATDIDGPDKRDPKEERENKCGNCMWFGEGHNDVVCSQQPADRANMPCFKARD